MVNAVSLPESDPELVSTSRKEYEALFQKGDSRSTEACFRLVWALVHSRRQLEVAQGLRLAEALIQSDEIDDAGKKDLVYFCCVAKYKMGKYVDAKHQVDELLKVSPNSRQGASLKEMIEDKIVKEGLIGVGIFATGAAVVGAILYGALSKR